jgi:tRNA C32,U32 (ribose-2'-O)-methylase TrmJ
MAQLEAAPRPPGPAPVAASHLDLEHLEAVLRTVLARSRFLVQDNRHAMRDLLAPLVRARLSRQEARLWTTALFAVARRLPGWS